MHTFHQQLCGVFRALARPPPPFGVLPHAFRHRGDEGVAVFLSPVAKRWGSTAERGGGRAAEPCGTAAGKNL